MHRRNEFDVTNRIDTTDEGAVSRAVCAIYQELYQRDDPGNIVQVFDDVTMLYRGEHPGYHACDTSYHDIQHVLDVTLAMARLMDGCVRATDPDTTTTTAWRSAVTPRPTRLISSARRPARFASRASSI